MSEQKNEERESTPISYDVMDLLAVSSKSSSLSSTRSIRHTPHNIVVQSAMFDCGQLHTKHTIKPAKEGKNRHGRFCRFKKTLADIMSNVKKKFGVIKSNDKKKVLGRRVIQPIEESQENISHMTYLKDSVKDGLYSTLSIGTEEKYRHEATGYNVGTVKPEEPPCNSNFIDKSWQKNKNLPFKAECTKIKSTSSSACFEEHWSDHSHTGDDQNVLHVCELLENEDFLPVHAAPNENCIPVCTNDQLSDDGFSVPMDTYGFCSADLYKSDTIDIGRTPTFDVAFSYGIPISDPCETAPVPSLRTPFQCIIGTQTEIINIQPEITSNSFSPSNQTTIVKGEGETNSTVTGEGETNSTVTGEGETHSTVTGEGETKSTVTGEGETDSTVTGEGEINSTVTGEGEINSTVTGEGESKSENDKTFVGDGESNSQNEEKFAGEKEFNGHYDVTVVLERKSNSHNDATVAGEKECNNQNNETVSKEKESNSQNNETFAEEKEFNCQNNEIFAGEKESKSHTDETFTEEKESNSQNNETLSGGKESNNQINETVSKEKESSSQNNETFAEEKEFNCQNNETLAGEKESNSHNDKTFAEEKESNSHNNGTFARQKESNSQNILTRADGRDPISQHDEMHTEDIGSDIRNDNICSEQGHPVDETHIDERENDSQNDEISAGGGTIDNQNNTKYVRIGRKCGSQRSGGLPTDSQIDETRVSRNTSDRHDKRHLMGKYEFNVEGGISYKVIYGNVNSVENLEVEFPNYNNAKIDRIRSCYKADTSREKRKRGESN